MEMWREQRRKAAKKGKNEEAVDYIRLRRKNKYQETCWSITKISVELSMLLVNYVWEKGISYNKTPPAHLPLRQRTGRKQLEKKTRTWKYYSNE